MRKLLGEDSLILEAELPHSWIDSCSSLLKVFNFVADINYLMYCVCLFWDIGLVWEQVEQVQPNTLS